MFINLLLSILLLELVEINGAPISNANPWNKQNVTYSITDTPMNMSPADVQEIISKAFNTWSSVIPLNFTEIDPSLQAADIQIIFISSEGNSLFEDRSGYVIPYEKIYLFADSPRAINAVGERVNDFLTDFYYEFLYDVGKVLGLRNSRNRNSMMFTGYTAPVDSNGNYVEPMLSADDVRAAQMIYGKRN